MSNTYVPLRVHTEYSIAEGAIFLKDIAGACAKKGIPACAITDTDSLAGIVDFTEKLNMQGVQPIMGVQLSLGHGGHRYPIALYAMNPMGRANMIKLMSKAAEMGESGSPALPIQALQGHTQGLIALSGGIHGPIDRALLAGDMETAEKRCQSLNRLFDGRFFLEISRMQTTAEIQRERSLLDLAENSKIPLVATNEAFFLTQDMHEAHDALLCIAEKRTIGEADRRKISPHAWLKGPEEMRELFSDLPQAIENTVQIAQMCHTSFEKKSPVLPRFPGLSEGQSEDEEILLRSKEGLKERLQSTTLSVSGDEYEKRLNYELDIIRKTGYAGYFLIVSDFIQWAKEKDIPVGPGRGSGAGSLVAWTLKITDIDPMRYGLLFERFLNPDRVSMPDFDIDFAQNGRDNVINYVRERYGQDHVVQIGTYMRMKSRAVVRNVGRAMGLSFGQVSPWASMIPNNPANPVLLSDAMEAEPLLSAFPGADPSIKALFNTALRLEGLTSATSKHAAGVVISSDPVAAATPLMRSEGVLVTQYAMKEVEKAGMVKFDFLGLKTLDVLQGAIAIEKARGNPIDLNKIGVDDKETYEMIARGETFSVFQLESAGMQSACKQVKPTKIEDIIALVSLYRPGPMENIPEYARVKHGEQEASYIDPSMEGVLKETNGIIVYQEQVMELARQMAGYSLSQADLLRRAMGKKIKSEMDAQREVFVTGCKKNGIGEENANAVFDLLAKFADYGFNKSHAAAYAVLAFQTAYLKCHHPQAFYASAMNLDMGETEKLAAFVQQAKQEGIEILPPDINRSGDRFQLETQNQRTCIRYALSAIRGVGESVCKQLVSERENGRFQNIDDLIKRGIRVGLNKKMLEGLAYSGALDSIAENRGTALANITTGLKEAQSIAKAESVGQSSLFDMLGSMNTTKKIPDMNKEEKLEGELESLGFFLSGHPLDGIRPVLRQIRGFTTLNEALTRDDPPNWNVTMAGLLLSVKYKTTKDRTPMAILRFSDPTNMTELIVFGEESVAKYKPLLVKGQPVLIKAKVRDNETGDRQVRLQELEELPVKEMEKAMKKNTARIRGR